ncbi:hypothetical protein [Hoeflea prorocentri]|uniref:Uncharacterized protein n=1 Tax=Hoeflea prorocentri TaxID=1922333 RepID=A0A9X3ZIX8_9HYPH|nr:hypothetical protein [Hoeflea prorocentri]MCY6382889.1 hypothetical protein [Hoeflea prorocentri]MDA5400689.1 hypothetical protein [Hoeflea prorocentri]
MMKWFCTLILLLFTATAGAALPAQPDGLGPVAMTGTGPAAAELGMKIGAADDCCADEVAAKPAAVPCLVDFSMVLCSFALHEPLNQWSFVEDRDRMAVAVLIDLLHRPPIV